MIPVIEFWPMSRESKLFSEAMEGEMVPESDMFAREMPMISEEFELHMMPWNWQGGTEEVQVER